MAKVLCIDDFVTYSEMIALTLEKKGGHQTAVAIVPFDLNNLRNFDPDVVVLNLVRKVEALGAPLRDFMRQVEGARAYQTIAGNPHLARYPLIVTAIAVQEAELPRDLSYVAFIDIPTRLDYLVQTVGRVALGRGHDIVPE